MTVTETPLPVIGGEVSVAVDPDPTRHSVRVDRIRDHQDPGRRQPADLAQLAREAATDIDRGHLIEGCRRLVAIGGLAKHTADILEAGRL